MSSLIPSGNSHIIPADSFGPPPSTSTPTFMGVPVEIRDVIYGYVFEDHHQVVLKPGAWPRPRISENVRSITMISRAIRHETAPLLWSNVTIYSMPVFDIPDFVWEFIRAYTTSITASGLESDFGFHWSDFATFRRLRVLSLQIRICPTDWKPMGINAAWAYHRKANLLPSLLAQKLLDRPHVCFGLGDRLQSVHITDCDRGIRTPYHNTRKITTSGGSQQTILSRFDIVSHSGTHQCCGC